MINAYSCSIDLLKIFRSFLRTIKSLELLVNTLDFDPTHY